jgi:hypothetical protein
MKIDQEALEEIFGSFQVAYKSMVYFANFQHLLSHVFHTCVVPHHEYARVDKAIHSMDPILSVGCPCVLYMRFPYASHTKDVMLYSRWTCHGLWCRHVLSYVCVLHYKYARQGYTPFKWRVSKVGHCSCTDKCMGAISIVNDNVWGCFRECWHWWIFVHNY